jgi:hypothetical protein
MRNEMGNGSKFFLNKVPKKKKKKKKKMPVAPVDNFRSRRQILF